MNGQKAKLPTTTQQTSLGKSKFTAVRPWPSSKTQTRRIEKRLSRLNGKLMNLVELKKPRSPDKSSFSSRNRRQVRP